jgi:hypothetical protein
MCVASKTKARGRRTVSVLTALRVSFSGDRVVCGQRR